MGDDLSNRCAHLVDGEESFVAKLSIYDVITQGSVLSPDDGPIRKHIQPARQIRAPEKHIIIGHAVGFVSMCRR